MRRILVIVGVLVSIPVAMSLWDLRRAVKLRQDAARVCQLPSEKIDGPPYLKGKLGVIDVAEKKWEPKIGSYLPPELMPERVEDIGTCVFLEWGAKVEGQYLVETTRGGVKQGTHTQYAMRQNCKITLVDRAEHKVIAEKMVFAPPPSDGFVSDGTGPSPAAGHKPIEEVEEWLFALPRR